MQNTPQDKGFAFSARPLKEALAEYDRTAAERDQLWTNAETNEDVLAAERAEKDALLKVQLAFHALTKDRNSLEHCKLVDLEFMRRCASLADNDQ